MTDRDIFAILLVLISPAVGSFLTVLVDRLPRGESVVWPGSACRTCRTRLGLRDLVPVLSFALGRGRCRHCATAIPAWHLYVELAAIGLAVIAVLRGGSLIDMAAAAMFLWLLLSLAVTDLVWFRLPDLLTLCLLIAALVLGRSDPWGAMTGAAVASGSFLALRLAYRGLRGREGLGLGDVKLMAGIGAAIGVPDLPLTLLVAAVAALTIVGVDAVLLRRTPRQAFAGSRKVPFGAALAGAAALVWLLRSGPF